MNATEFEEKYGYDAKEKSDITEKDCTDAKEKNQKYIEKHGHGSRTFETIIDIYETNHTV